MAGIIFNLLGNAAKYSPTEAPMEVVIELVGDAAEIVVRDHGSGVATADTETIFAQYVQTDAATTGSDSACTSRARPRPRR